MAFEDAPLVIRFRRSLPLSMRQGSARYGRATSAAEALPRSSGSIQYASRKNCIALDPAALAMAAVAWVATNEAALDQAADARLGLFWRV